MHTIRYLVAVLLTGLLLVACDSDNGAAGPQTPEPGAAVTPTTAPDPGTATSSSNSPTGTAPAVDPVDVQDPTPKPYLRIVTSVRPMELWVNELIATPDRDAFEVRSIIPTHVDPTTYQLSDADRAILDAADLVVIDGSGIDQRFIQLAPDSQKVFAVLTSLAEADPDYRLPRLGLNQYNWLDPLIMAVATDLLSRRIAREIRGLPEEPDVRRRIKEQYRSFKDACETMDIYMTRDLSPLGGIPIVTQANGLSPIADRYRLSPVIVLNRRGMTDLDPEVMASAIGALADGGEIFVETPFEPTDEVKRLAEQTGATITTLDLMGVESDSWTEMIGAIRKTILRAKPNA